MSCFLFVIEPVDQQTVRHQQLQAEGGQPDQINVDVIEKDVETIDQTPAKMFYHLNPSV